jgi:HPt (histidine-containing phosphotransfer) domain-containing protein
MIQELRVGIARAEASGDTSLLRELAGKVSSSATGAHAEKMSKLASTLEDLAQG